jgi:hypothetical protein
MDWHDLLSAIAYLSKDGMNIASIAGMDMFSQGTSLSIFQG